ncbi:MAG: hypothetical protein CVT88_03890 [Candidatus Altiarchaeales archaeon HGW-Altiarchaeales-1]|nr:MAG: hypothetical protein CVT88_03890 [Candidatus Altiarchaeales archaeon HGW-Altiarchaeales-1]
MNTKKCVSETQRGNGNFGKGNALNFVLAGLFAVVLVFLAGGNVFAYAPDGGGNCECDSCGDCTDALNDNMNCIGTVKLNNSINPDSGDCITNPKNFNNKIFDCQGHTIEGSGDGAGIYLFNKTNNTVRNCIITNFDLGIGLDSSSNNILTNNTASANTQFGIYLGRDSNNNSLTLNHMCNNSQSDVYVDQINAATGDNNTCLSSLNYHDATNVSGCKSICQIDNCNCSSCGECSYKLSHPDCSQVNLTADMMDHSGSCIENPINFNNKIFDCQGHIIDGIKYPGSFGIGFKHKQNNTIRNCVITEFERGIEMGDSVNNTLVNNTLNSLENGILLRDYSSNNILANNTLNSSVNGIFLSDGSSNNTLTNNTANLNIMGIVLLSSSNNILKISDFYQDIDISNLVNGQPIFYWTNEKYGPNSCTNAEISELNNTGFVALVSCDNITVKNLNLQDNSHGILLVNTTNSKILNNTANSNMFGIYLFSSFNNILTNNTANSNMFGIGLFLSPNNTLRNNTFANNGQNFNIKGMEISHFYQDIDKSNSVEGKPIFYWTNEKNVPDGCKNAEINELNNSGFVALISCDNITVKNLNLHNNSHGILLINTTNSKIINNTANSNEFGIVLVTSNNNSINNNTANLNIREGISLSLSSNNNTLINNIANSNRDIGIHIDYSSDNVLTNNIANSNRDIGIHIDYSSDNVLTNNIVNSNWHYGVFINFYSNNNNITNNTVNSNMENGISLYGSLNNTLRNNNVNENNVGIYSENSNSTIIENWACDNIQSDFSSPDWSESNGTNNTCSNSNGWNDTGTTGGCTYICMVNCNCSSCNSCYAKLNGHSSVCPIMTLNDDVVVPSETFPTCIDNPENFTNRIFDCQGHTITGNGGGVGIYLNGKTNNTIKNCGITNFEKGISLENSPNNTLSNNTAISNLFGISLFSSQDNILRNNLFTNNMFNFNIDGEDISHYVQDIDKSNVINTRPIFYLTNCKNLEINESSNAGFVALISCDNITVKNLNLDNNSQGILLVNTTNSKILNNAANSNYEEGIFLYYSVDNTLTNNTANSNYNNGIFLLSSFNNNMTNNTANSNLYGIFLLSASNNTLANNTANSNHQAIYLHSSGNNYIVNNTINLNENGIYIFSYSNFNKISNNQISNNNETGITISNCDARGHCFIGEENSNNTIEDNQISNNKIGIFSRESNSTINGNYICENTELDFNSTNWLPSLGDNNYCDKANGWNDTSAIGCANTCKAKDLFDLVEMLEYLNGEKNLSYPLYCDLDNNHDINLPDAFALIAQIVIQN